MGVQRVPGIGRSHHSRVQDSRAHQTLHVHNLAAQPWVGLWANPKRMYHGKAGKGTWQVDLQASDIDIENMTTSQLLSLRTMPHTGMSGNEKPISANLKKRFQYIEFRAKLLNYFSR